MKFDQVRPCALCPFRNDEQRLTVHPDRFREFLFSFEFPCHKTAELAEGDPETGEGEGYQGGDDAQACAGWLIMNAKLGGPSQGYRIAGRLGMIDESRLDMSAPVFDSIREADRDFARRSAEQKTAKRKRRGK